MQFDNKNEGTKQSLFVFRIDSPMLLPSASARLVLARGEGGRLTVLLGLFKSSELGEGHTPSYPLKFRLACNDHECGFSCVFRWLVILTDVKIYNWSNLKFAL